MVTVSVMRVTPHKDSESGLVAAASDSHDGLEVIVHQDHVGCLLADVGARLAHRHADVSSLQSHGIVHPVARHGHHGAIVLQGLKRGAGLYHHFVLESRRPVRASNRSRLTFPAS